MEQYLGAREHPVERNDCEEIAPGVFVFDEFSPYCAEIESHILANQHLYYQQKNHCVKRYHYDPYRVNPDAHVTPEFPDIAKSYNLSLHEAVLDVSKEKLIGSNLAGMIYEPGCRLPKHNDSDGGIWTTVHYVSSSHVGGELVFEDVVVSANYNRLVVFDSSREHSANATRGGTKVTSSQFWKRLVYLN